MDIGNGATLTRKVDTKINLFVLVDGREQQHRVHDLKQ